jgi:hypothetical protein
MQFVWNILLGNTVREYVTVSLQGAGPERVYLTAGEFTSNVSQLQWLLCLNPPVFGVWQAAGTPLATRKLGTLYTLYYVADEKSMHREAVLTLELLDKMEEKEGTLLLLKVKNSQIHHIDPFRTRLLYHKFYKKPGFSFDNMKAYAAAYSYPRRVRIISFKEDEEHQYFFPMDLLGEITESHIHFFGLRHSNLALKKIMAAQKIVISEVPAQYKSVIYQLGKGHITAPQPVDRLPFPIIRTAEFDFSIPAWAESYKEVRIQKTLNLGSHMLLIGRWANEVTLKPPTPRLHHIHFLHFLQQKKRGQAYPPV